MMNEIETELIEQELSDTELHKAITRLVDEFDQHDEYLRDRQVRILKRNELFIQGIQNIYFSEIAHDYRYLADDGNDSEEYDPDLDNKNANVMMPYRDSVVAALSVGIPTTLFYPNDADVAADIFAAHTWSRAAELIRRKNKARLLFIKALSTVWTGGLVAAYNYSEKNKKFGMKKEPIYEDMPNFINDSYCPECGRRLQSEQTAASMEGLYSTMECPNCGEIQPVVEVTQEKKSVISGYDSIPKVGENIEIFSGLHVQIAPWAKKIGDTPYLILNEEMHIAQAREDHPSFWEKIRRSDSILYDRWARMLTYYGDDTLMDICTRRKVWLRAWAFNAITDDSTRKMLKTLYPKGMRATLINDVVVEVEHEDLDEHWTIGIDPQSSFLHGTPQANGIIPIQEMTREHRILTLETMRYSIPETYVVKNILNWNALKNREVKPGSLVPTKDPTGKSLSDHFYTSKTASLSQEHAFMGKQLQQDGQFSSGAFPSIYGGSLEGGSGTAAEYSMSRAQALQRLQTQYAILSFFWAELEGKAVADLLSNLKEDTNYVVPQGNGFLNIWIRKSQMNGEVGQITTESSEQFPTSWAQQRDILYQLVQSNNDFINQALFHPENRHLFAEIIGLANFYVPGDEDRTKQLGEIVELMKGQPIAGPGIMLPTVPIEEDLDDHEVHIEIIKAWLVSDVGQDAKISNPLGYQNEMAHLKMHVMYIQSMMQAQAQAQESEDVSEPK
jgi:hypothetical protein